MPADAKSRYRGLCKDREPLSVFALPWWLDAVCTPDGWDVATVNRGGEIVASLPYYMKRPGLITMPPFTQTLGPWILPGTGKYESELSREKELMLELIDALPRHRLFSQNFHHSVTNWLPFHWRDFRQTTRYTYIVDNLTDLDVVWNAMASSTRRAIRKAQKLNIAVESGTDGETLLRLNDLTNLRQRRRVPDFSLAMKRLVKAAAEHKAGRVFVARDNEGEAQAAAFVCWSPTSAYYVFGGADPRHRSSGAQSLVLWEAIRYAAGVSASFDFEGSMVESIEQSFRRFGARQVRYFTIFRDTRSPVIRFMDRIVGASSNLLRSTE